MQYCGILDGGGTVWGVRIPALPGCHGGGGTRDEAIADAISAAHEWINYRVAKGLPWPAATALNQADILENEEIVLIDLPDLEAV